MISHSPTWSPLLGHSPLPLLLERGSSQAAVRVRDFLFASQWKPKPGQSTSRNPSARCIPLCKLCKPKFILAFFFYVSEKDWKNPKCPSIEDWPYTFWYIHTVGKHTAIGKNDVPDALQGTASKMHFGCKRHGAEQSFCIYCTRLPSRPPSLSSVTFKEMLLYMCLHIHAVFPFFFLIFVLNVYF